MLSPFYSTGMCLCVSKVHESPHTAVNNHHRQINDVVAFARSPIFEKKDHSFSSGFSSGHECEPGEIQARQKMFLHAHAAIAYCKRFLQNAHTGFPCGGLPLME
jgi:hypothetical protein